MKTIEKSIGGAIENQRKTNETQMNIIEKSIGGPLENRGNH